MRAAAVPVAVALGATALFCVGLVVLPDAVSAIVDAFALSLAPAVAGVMARRRSRRDAVEARPWRGVAIALACTAVGQVLWFVSEIAGAATNVVLVVSHAAYFAALPAAAASVREVLGPLERRQRRNHTVEVATVAAAAVASSWLVAWPSLEGDLLLADVVGVLYPIGYLTLGGALLFALSHRRSAELASFAVLAMGLLAAAGANMWFAATGTRPDYVAGHPVDGAWFAAYALVVAATFVAPTARRTAEARASHPTLLLPYIPLVLAFAVVLVGPHDAMDHPVVVVAAVALLGLVLLRQYATLVDNVRLAAELATRQSLTLASGRIGTLEVDLATNEATFSDEVAAICGRDPADMPTTLAGALDLVPASDLGDLIGALDKAITEGTAATEYRVVRPDGELCWVETRAEVQGHRLVGVVFDITLRKRAEEELVRVARHDTLTGLLARGAITEQIDATIASGTPAALFLLDLVLG
jgi:PAS domain-containing protein